MAADRDGLDPSLTSDLWVFHVAADAPTFQAAAERIFVTQSAVSQRITRLEKRLGVQLFERRGRTVALTARGKALFASTQEAFDILSPAVRALGKGSGLRSISVNCSPPLALEWLTPRIGRFLERHPGIGVQIDGDTRDLSHRALKAAGIDVYIRYGPSAFTDAPLAFSVDELCFPVAAPFLLDKLDAAPDEVSSITLLHDAAPWEQAPSKDIEWRTWLESRQLPWSAASEHKHIYFNQAQMSYRAAMEGLGIAMGRKTNVSRFMEYGWLRKVAEEAPPTIIGIYVHIESRIAPPHVQQFLDWLAEEFVST